VRVYYLFKDILIGIYTPEQHNCVSVYTVVLHHVLFSLVIYK